MDKRVIEERMDAAPGLTLEDGTNMLFQNQFMLRNLPEERR